jgi:hypothetical protein
VAASTYFNQPELIEVTHYFPLELMQCSPRALLTHIRRFEDGDEVAVITTSDWHLMSRAVRRLRPEIRVRVVVERRWCAGPSPPLNMPLPDFYRRLP